MTATSLPSTYLLGIDLGTASSKAVLTTVDGRVVATATRPRPHSMSMPHPRWAEVDAEAVWWADVTSLSRELVSRVGADAVAGVCVSGVGPCLVLTDAEDRPVRPAILYGIDMRSVDEIAELNDRLGSDAVLAAAGSELSSQAVGPKALWVQRHEPAAWAASARWHTASSWVVARMTGEYVIDHHTASQSVPLYDLGRADWHAEWYPLVMGDLPAPRLAWAAEVVGEVSAAAAEQTGLRPGTPVCAGTVDAWAEAVSAGVREPGDLMLMYGSTMFFVQVLERARPVPRLWTTAGAWPGSTTLAAGMATSGSITTWLRDLTGGVAFEQLVEEAAATPPGADGLLVLPYFAGERTPVFDPDARGVLAGLTLRHGRGHLLRAVYEGIAYGIRQILELLDGDENPVRRLVAVGGGTQGGLWTQVVSDVTGREQEVPAVTIGASHGDAYLAGVGTGLVDPATTWAVRERTVRPDPGRRALYDELSAAYTELYPATRPVVHALAAVQGRAS